MGAYSKPRVVNQKRCDKRNDSSLARGKRFPRFSYVFVSTFVGFLLFRKELGSGVGIDTRNNSCLRVRVHALAFPECRGDAADSQRQHDTKTIHAITITPLFRSFLLFSFSQYQCGFTCKYTCLEPSSCVLICASAIIQSVERALLNYSCFRFQEASGEDG